ncbi:hypothetical protein MED222_09243 [Vibrio sp. MED222]|nr:hypothetical protein MED222_09243 [Vibrio sp. MED222]
MFNVYELFKLIASRLFDTKKDENKCQLSYRLQFNETQLSHSDSKVGTVQVKHNGNNAT